jgi:two-component system, chemotaxis family, sensor histidine kinase and response regulator PixL
MTDPQFEESLDRYFAIESEELIQTIEQTLVSLLEEKTVERVHTLMRAAHTIKGGAANCGLKTIETIAHHLEDVFQALYPEELAIDDELGALLLEGYEVLYTPISAILSGYTCDEEQIMTQTADLFARLQAKLGDFFGREAPLPTAEDLGFDVVALIFGDSVPEDLDKLSAALQQGDAQKIKETLLPQAEFFLELGASYELPGIEEIAKATITAVDLHPDRIVDIATASLENFRTAREQILAGDRAKGGEISPALALWTEANPDLSNYVAPVTAPAAASPAVVEMASAQSIAADPDDMVSFADMNIGNSTDNSLMDLFGSESSEDEDFSGLLDLVDHNPNETSDLLDLIDLDDSKPAPQEISASTNELFGLLDEPIVDASEMVDLLNLMDAGTSTADSAANLGLDQPATGEVEDLLDLLGDAPPTDELMGLMEEPVIVTETIPTTAEIPETIILESIDGELVVESSASDTNPASSSNTALAAIGTAAATGAGALAYGEFSGAAAADMSPIDRILQSISTYLPEAQPPKAAPPPVSSTSGPTIRVGLERLERIGNAIGELVIDENQQNARAERIHRLNQEAIEELGRANYQLGRIRDWSDQNLLQSVHGVSAKQNRPRHRRHQEPTARRQVEAFGHTPQGFDILEMDVYSDLHILIQKLNDHLEEMGNRLERLESSTQKLRVRQDKRRQLFTAAQDELLQARMEPIATVFDRFPRLVQQMTIKHKKPAELVLIGTGVLVDKAVADKLYDPLLHLIRNSYDHGLEAAEIRTERGKQPTGRITVSAHHHGNRTTIEVRDDGGGLNFDRIRQKGIERQLMTVAQAQAATEDQLADLLFHPGFSTADQVSELSGRGIGLDVVRTQIEAFDGSITVRSIAGQGSTFTLQIPLSFTTARLLICEAKGKTYGLLSDALNQAIIPAPDRLQVVDGGLQYRQIAGGREQLLAVRNLADAIDYNCPVTLQDANSDKVSLLLVSANGQQLCIAVDRIVGEQELAISPIGNTLPLPNYVQGYSTLSDGSLVLTVDPVALLTGSRGSKVSLNRRAPVPNVPAPALAAAEEVVEAELLPFHSSANSQITILVVDDSLVQRQGLLRTLAGAGYQVLQAANGQEALAQLNQHPEIRVVVCDIEMPYMNGFEFLSYCRQDARLSQIPTIMLTTRSGAKHRQLALALGAKAYTTKPHSDQELLAAVEKQLAANLAPV